MRLSGLRRNGAARTRRRGNRSPGVVGYNRQDVVAASSAGLRLLRSGCSGRPEGRGCVGRRPQEWVNAAGGLIFDARLT